MCVYKLLMKWILVQIFICFFSRLKLVKQSINKELKRSIWEEIFYNLATQNFRSAPYLWFIKHK